MIQIERDGSRRAITREWIPETPIALEYNGLSYAVMMASPTDLEDFARGFALTEGLARRPSDVREIAVAEVEFGHIVRTNLTGLGIEQLSERVRTRVAQSSCGLCGIENLEALARPMPAVPPHQSIRPQSVFSGMKNMRDQQQLNRQTGAAHAAAFAEPSGGILFVREDVGRHNAIDKLVGALAKARAIPAEGLFLSSARCSFEIVEKVVRAGGVALATVSLPTTLAVERAKTSGLSLYCLARDDSFLDLSTDAIALQGSDGERA